MAANYQSEQFGSSLDEGTYSKQTWGIHKWKYDHTWEWYIDDDAGVDSDVPIMDIAYNWYGDCDVVMVIVMMGRWATRHAFGRIILIVVIEVGSLAPYG